MSIDRGAAFFVGACLLIAAIATSAIAQSKHTRAAATRDVRQLMLLMDKDGGGTVSKQEFMDFMSQTFDRLDVDHSRQLVARRVAPLDEAGLDDGAACGTRPCALTGSAASVAARWLCGRSIGVGPDACRRVAAATPRSR